MAKLSVAQIQAEARQKLAAKAEGMRWTVLVNEIKSEHPETPINTIWGATNGLFKKDDQVVKISKGTYALKPVVSGKHELQVKPDSIAKFPGVFGTQVSEADFYQPFADWLRDGLDEVTEAIPIGGNIFKGKWNTPDVIGVLRPLKGDLIKFEPQIVAAEIKIDPAQPVTAFGQAVSYRLFSHKCYLVLPRITSDDDLDRIEALSVVFGLGLVLFDLHLEDPKFELVVRATLAQPDMVYVNQMAQRLNAYDSKAFDRLF